MRIAYRKNLDIYVRPNSSDDYVCDEVSDYDRVFTSFSGSGKILDIGANIGAFSRRALNRFPNAMVTAIEPDPQAFDVLNRNLRKFSVHKSCLQAAIAANSKTTILHSSKNPDHFSGHTTIKGMAIEGDYDQVKVEALSFDSILESFNPEIVKMDIEGAELEILLNSKLFPYNIKGFAIEIHATKGTILDADEAINLISDSFPYLLGDQHLETPLDGKINTTLLIGLRN